MEIILGIIIIVVLVFIFTRKKVQYSKNTIDILKENFPNSNFSKIDSIATLKENLQINPQKNYDVIINKILTDAEHKVDILYKHRMKENKPYNDFTSLKVTANCVIDYAIKKNISLGDSIKILFVVLTTPLIEENIAKPKTQKETLKDFFDLLEGFALRYNKAKDD
jgi:hypothetical protein